MKKLLATLVTLILLCSMSISFADGTNSNVKLIKTETIYKNGSIYKNEIYVIESKSKKNQVGIRALDMNTTEVRLYKSTIIMSEGMFRPTGFQLTNTDYYRKPSTVAARINLR